MKIEGLIDLEWEEGDCFPERLDALRRVTATVLPAPIGVNASLLSRTLPARLRPHMREAINRLIRLQLVRVVRRSRATRYLPIPAHCTDVKRLLALLRRGST